jgi:predicted RNA-binding Zn ribbon-like protein
VNTVHSRIEIEPHDYLQDYADLARWAEDEGLLSPREHRDLLDSAESEKPTSIDLESFNKSLGAALSRRRVRRIHDNFDWSWEPGDAPLDRPLWPVILSAAELLATGDRRRLKECPAPEGCGWLYLDTSKNGTRKWCNMKTCGNIAKARRYYKRHSKPKSRTDEII